MALNWTMLSESRSPIPLPGEYIVTRILNSADLALTIPDVPPTGSGTSGGSGSVKVLKERGSIWLTDQRLIFATPGPNTSFESLSVPLSSVLWTKFEQPYFGANYLSFGIKPSPGGGLTDGTWAELRLNHPMFEFVSLLEKTRERAIFMKRHAITEEEDAPPLYTQPASSSTASRAQTPSDNPPTYDA